MGKRYIPSNQLSVPLLLLFLILGLVISSFIAILTALLGLWLIPPYAGIAFAFVAAGCIYWIMAWCIKLSKNRNLFAARTVILITSLVAGFIHIGAVSAVATVLGDSVRQISLNMNFETLQQIFVGSVAYFIAPLVPIKNMLDAGGSWIIYLILSVLFFLLIPQLAAEQAKEPFSEEYNQWMQKVHSVGRLELIPDREQRIIITALKVGDITPILRRPRYSSQLSDNYTVVAFFKVKNAYTGFVSVENYHQMHDNKNRPIEGRFQIIEFIPLIQIGVENASSLENAINVKTSSMDKEQAFSTNIPEPSTTLDVPEEFGYRLYRTADDGVLTFDSDMLERARDSETLRHYRRSPKRELSESFQYYAGESNKSRVASEAEKKEEVPLDYPPFSFDDFEP